MRTVFIRIWILLTILCLCLGGEAKSSEKQADPVPAYIKAGKLYREVALPNVARAGSPPMVTQNALPEQVMYEPFTEVFLYQPLDLVPAADVQLKLNKIIQDAENIVLLLRQMDQLTGPMALWAQEVLESELATDDYTVLAIKEIRLVSQSSAYKTYWIEGDVFLHSPVPEQKIGILKGYYVFNAEDKLWGKRSRMVYESHIYNGPAPVHQVCE